jgi:hypothetical protein
LIIYWDFTVKKDVEEVYFNAGVLGEDNKECIWVTSKANNTVQFPLLTAGSNYRIAIEIPQHHLMPNIYMPSIFIRSDKTGETYERIWSNYAFRVVTDGNTLGKGVVAAQANWELKKLN